MDSKGKLRIMGKMAKREANFDSHHDDDDDDDLHRLVGGGCEDDYGDVKKKRGKGSGGGGKRCQVERCAADLSDAKQYHRRHKVCEQHAKAQVVLVSGIRQRFCQQCSRFHEVGEFDDTKRSCRRRLAGHNERRRKSSADPQLGLGSEPEGSSLKGPGTSEVQDMMRGPVDDRRRIKLTIQQTAGYKHCHIR